VAPNESPNAHYTCLDISQENNALFVGSDSGGVSQWDINADRNACTAAWQTSQGELSIIKCQGDKLITCGQSSHVRVWGVGLVGAGADVAGRWTVLRDIRLDAPVHSLSMDAEGSEGVAATVAEGSEGVAATVAGTVYHLGASGVPPVQIGGGHAAPITGLACSDSGELVASCAADGTVILWAADGMQHLRRWQPSDGAVGCCCVAFAPSGRSLAAGYSDGVLRQMDLSIRSGPPTVSDAVRTRNPKYET
ncbi:WD40-repeat-containing domain protein, partial [Baffinella frigidus]